jgi:hypothetical protein
VRRSAVSCLYNVRKFRGRKRLYESFKDVPEHGRTPYGKPAIGGHENSDRTNIPTMTETIFEDTSRKIVTPPRSSRPRIEP